MTAGGAVRISIVNDYELVVAGVAALLAPYADRVEVVELDSRLPTISDVDLVLYDTFGQTQGKALDVPDLVRGGTARVVVFSWNVQPDLVEEALAQGAAGYLSKALTAEEIVEALELVHSGETVLPPSEAAPDELIAGDYPGRVHGLSPREAEIIALITQGMTNQQIAERTYLSINSVKTYIRTGYAKVGVTKRSHAVIWGMTHGFEPDRTRLLGPNA